MDKYSIVAFIPARSGSKRIPNKNIVFLAGHPLIAHTITAAIKSNIYDAILFITDSQDYAEIAKCYGIDEIYPQNASDTKSEYDAYLKWILETLKEEGRNFDCFSILRPTSPFRTSETIKRAWAEFIMNQPVDSLRAVEPCKQHPGKMYDLYEGMTNFIPLILPTWDTTNCKQSIPMRDMQIQALPEIWVQNGSLEIAWTDTLNKYNSFSGERIYPFRTRGYEGFDINRPEDLVVANWLIQEGKVKLNAIN